MAKQVANAVLDAALDKIATSTRQVVTSAEPANFAGISAVALADVTMTAGTDYTIADGTSGRKVTTAAKATVTVDATGTATHTCLDDGTTLLYVTTCTSQALTSGNTVDIPQWVVQIADPT